MHPVLSYLKEHQKVIVDDLKQAVALESPSFDKVSLDMLGRHLAAKFRAVGAEVETLPREDRGDILRVCYGSGEDGQTLVLCHMDTVFSAGDIGQNPIRIEEGRLYGPGACDMKAGIISGLWAFGCMKALSISPRRKVVLLVTTDEEIGSHASRTLIEEEAGRSNLALVMEPALPPHGALKTWRKGNGDYKVTISGRPAHAGADPSKGVNAAIEAAHQMLRIESLNNLTLGTSVVIGVVRGGTRRNVVPAECVIEVDNRFTQLAEGVRVRERLHALAPVLPGARIQVEGDIDRPPMVRGDMTVALYESAQRLWQEMGLGELPEGGTGGVSDGNLTSGAGCPTLDGLGAVGDGLHTFHEYVEIASLPERTALLVRLLETV